MNKDLLDKKTLPRILFIMQLPPPVHGASMSNSYLLKSKLLQNAFDCHIINLKFASSMETLKKFTMLKLIKSAYYGWLIFFKIVRNRPDLAYFTLSPSGYAFFRDAMYVLILKLFRIKIMFHLHGKGIKKSSENSTIKTSLYKFVFKNTKVICLTKNLTKDIENVYSQNPFIVPYGIPIHPKSSLEKIRSNEVVQILYLSNYVESKGILKLIDALKLLKEHGIPFNARLVGAPTDLTVEAVETYIKRNELQNHILAVGPKYGEDKYNEFHAADIFIFPTYYSNEALPLVNLEAMQFGLPVISSNEGGISESVIDNKTGYIINPHDIKQIFDKMILLIESNELRMSMGRNAKTRFLENYTLEKFEHNINKAFLNVIQSV